jgi:hypothetical protein
MLYMNYEDMVLFTDKKEEVFVNLDGTLQYSPTNYSFSGESIDAEEVDDLNKVIAFLQTKYCSALALVKKAFRGKKDKAGKPYIQHLIAVSNSVSTYQEQIIGLLHDLLEDTDYTYDYLLDNFGYLVANAVRKLTHEKDVDYMDYIKQIKIAAPYVRNVKIADLCNNVDLGRLSEVTDEDRQRQKKYLKALVYLLS